LFLSYSAVDRDEVRWLAAGLGHAGFGVRMDRRLAGDDGWWAGVLAGILEADAFLLAMSRSSLDSPACQRSRDYAVAVGLPVLCVRLETVTEAGHGDQRQTDFIEGSADDAFRLVGAIAALPARGLAGWQAPPEAPYARIEGPARDVTSAAALGHDEQLRLVARLRDSVEQGIAPAAARELAAVLRRRDDLDGDTVRRLDEVFPLGGREPAVEQASVTGLPWVAGPPVGTLTESAVRDISFRKPPMGRRGYDERSVDEFLDLVEADLRVRRAACAEAGGDGVVAVNLVSADVRAVAFERSAFGRRGYDEREVDEFLDEVDRTFTVLDAELARRGARITFR
jgi:DivIVA domain-containing protein